MSVNKVSYFGKTLIDLTGDSVTPATLASGVTAHDKSGNTITGTMQKHNAKVYHVTVPTAVAATDVTVVTGDPDVAAHYADADAMVTVRKMTNNSSNGTSIIVMTNHLFPAAYGVYMNYNGSANGTAIVTPNATGLTYTGTNTSTPYVKCTASGDIIVHPQRTSNNFGGAEYIITFSW